MRSIHDGIKRKCTLCPRIFTRVSILKAHMQQSHNVSRSTKPTRYPCDMCSNIFTTTTSMHRHVELAHFPDKTSCPYGCPIKVGSEVEWVTHLEGCDSPKMVKKILVNMRHNYYFSFSFLECRIRARVRILWGRVPQFPPADRTSPARTSRQMLPLFFLWGNIFSPKCSP